MPILFRDERLLVVDKPPGVLSLPELPERLARQGIEALPVHRLDRDVSGALILALDEETRAALETLFRERAVKKTYWALAQGKVRPPQGSWQFPILEDGPLARVSALGLKSQTRYRTLEALPNSSVLEIDLVTGRKNQIRLHAALLELHVVDQAQVDDVDRDLRVVDLAQFLVHVFEGRHGLGAPLGANILALAQLRE